jgi:predicted nucleic acid-binding protein
MSVAEMNEMGIFRNWGPGRFAKLSMFLSHYVLLPSTEALCRRWAQVRHERRSRPIGVADAWIVATALEYGLELVTHNARDFQGIVGLTVITEAP